MNPIVSIGTRGYDAVLSLVYPQACAACGASVESRHDGVVCSSCWDSTSLFQETDILCWKCGALSRGLASAEQRDNVRCGRCDTDAFTVARACGPYEGALRASILQLKQRPHVASRLVNLMLELLHRAPLNLAEVIVPVPLHPSRERERGFNQGLILARELACASRLPLDEHSLIRHVHTSMHRGGMDGKARRASVESAFALRHADLIAGKRVLLVDDVFTTGATVSACADVLTIAGAKEVFALTVARVA